MAVNIGNDWDNLLKEEFNKSYYQELRTFLIAEYRNKVIYPDMHDIFNALKYTAYEDVKVVILGQDPYIKPNQAHGLSFSVQKGEAIPPSLKNIYKEIMSDVGVKMPNHGYLKDWTKQGVMLLNTVLTVVKGASNSHKNKGWETFTDHIIKQINNKDKPVVFMLWGNNAIAKANLIDNKNHLILTAKHPSPLAGGAFFGCKHFSAANNFLQENNIEPINWQIAP